MERAAAVHHLEPEAHAAVERELREHALAEAVNREDGRAIEGEQRSFQPEPGGFAERPQLAAGEHRRSGRRHEHLLEQARGFGCEAR